ncbi:MAG: phosphopyruvate hydratase [Acidobacteriota bacterium]
MPKIKRLTAREILDSRGWPTVQASCELDGGGKGTASVPSGASKGTAEALELRDGDPKRYRGLGCRKAVNCINEELHNSLADRPFADQSDLDKTMIKLDGTPNKSRLGANAVLAVSIAHARAVAVQHGVMLFQHFAHILGQPLGTLPRPTINLFSGGKHAGGQFPIQDVMVVHDSACTMDEALAMTFEVYQSAAELTRRKYGTRALTADEGGLAPPFPDAEAMLEDVVESICRAGLKPGEDIAIAIDVASSHFYRDGRYHIASKPLDSGAMIENLQRWLEYYPIVSIEDGLAEEDWDNWPKLCVSAAGQALVVGDDLLCTSPVRIRRAIESRAANALLLKVNQVGTLTEAAEACKLARSADWKVSISARSGETEDDWLADLAVGWSGDQVKIGSITQSERLAKYNRLLAIEAETHLPLANWPSFNRG